MNGTLLDDYRRALDAIAQPVGSVSAGDLARPTPCAAWDVAALVGHVLGAVRYYAALARDGEVHAREVTVPVGPGDDLRATFDGDARAGLAEWSAPGVLHRECRMVLGPMQGADALAIHVADLTVHAWDLAVALGLPRGLPDDLAERALATWRRLLDRHPLRGRAFGPELPVPAGADATARLVAYCGRAA